MKSDAKYVRFLAECCEALEVDVGDVLGKYRGHGPVLEARFLLTYLLRENFKLSYPALARVMCRLDHTTMIHADRKFRALIAKRDPKALAALARVDGIERPITPIEHPLDSLRYCGADDGRAIELDLSDAPIELEEVG